MALQVIDSHAHFNSHDFLSLSSEIERINKNSHVQKLINVGLDYETSKETIILSQLESKFYSSIGIHPLYEGDVKKLYELYSLFDSHKIVAIGETGLDRTGDIKEQSTKFIEQIFLANYYQLPLIIHANNTNHEVLSIIRKYPPLYGFVFHCFQPNMDIAKEILEMGGFLSFGTPITRVNAKKSLEVIKMMPIERILIELDYPYMSQDPEIDGKNVYHMILKLTGLSLYELADQLTLNTETLFPKLKKIK